MEQETQNQLAESLYTDVCSLLTYFSKNLTAGEIPPEILSLCSRYFDQKGDIIPLDQITFKKATSPTVQKAKKAVPKAPRPAPPKADFPKPKGPRPVPSGPPPELPSSPSPGGLSLSAPPSTTSTSVNSESKNNINDNNDDDSNTEGVKPGAKAGAGTWELTHDEDGKIKYWNVSTGETRSPTDRESKELIQISSRGSLVIDPLNHKAIHLEPSNDLQQIKLAGKDVTLVPIKRTTFSMEVDFEDTTISLSDLELDTVAVQVCQILITRFIPSITKIDDYVLFEGSKLSENQIPSETVVKSIIDTWKEKGVEDIMKFSFQPNPAKATKKKKFQGFKKRMHVTNAKKPGTLRNKKKKKEREPSPPPEDSKIRMQGYLQKEKKHQVSTSLKKPAKLWCTVRNNALYYYTGPLNIAPLGKFEMGESTFKLPKSKTVDETAFEVSVTIDGEKKEYYLHCASKEERGSWLKLISKVQQEFRTENRALSKQTEVFDDYELFHGIDWKTQTAPKDRKSPEEVMPEGGKFPKRYEIGEVPEFLNIGDYPFQTLMLHGSTGYLCATYKDCGSLIFSQTNDDSCLFVENDQLLIAKTSKFPLFVSYHSSKGKNGTIQIFNSVTNVGRRYPIKCSHPISVLILKGQKLVAVSIDHIQVFKVENEEDPTITRIKNFRILPKKAEVLYPNGWSPTNSQLSTRKNCIILANPMQIQIWDLDTGKSLFSGLNENSTTDPWVSASWVEKPLKWTVFEEVYEKWLQPATKLPVAIDFPRLWAKIEIFSDELGDKFTDDWYQQPSVVIDIPDGDKDAAMGVKFAELCTKLGKCENCLDFYNTRWDKMTGEPSDIVRPALKFDERVIRVLKSINQAIIASAFVYLKRAFSFSDTTGFWKVLIHIKKNSVIVSHVKSGIGMDGEYNFTWEWKMTFDRDVTEMLDAYVNLITIEKNDKINASVDNSITQCFSALQLDSFVITGSSKTVSYWNIVDSKIERQLFSEKNPFSGIYADGTNLLVGTGEGLLTSYDIQTFTKLNNVNTVEQNQELVDQSDFSSLQINKIFRTGRWLFCKHRDYVSTFNVELFDQIPARLFKCEGVISDIVFDATEGVAGTLFLAVQKNTLDLEIEIIVWQPYLKDRAY